MHLLAEQFLSTEGRLVMTKWTQLEDTKRAASGCRCVATESTMAVSALTACRRPFAVLLPASCWNLRDARCSIDSVDCLKCLGLKLVFERTWLCS